MNAKHQLTAGAGSESCNTMMKGVRMDVVTDAQDLQKPKAETVKFNIHNVALGALKARVHYSLDNRVDGRNCVTIYAKDYGGTLGKIFGSAYVNRTDTMADVFDQGNATLFESHPLYAMARARAEAIKLQRSKK